MPLVPEGEAEDPVPEGVAFEPEVEAAVGVHVGAALPTLAMSTSAWATSELGSCAIPSGRSFWPWLTRKVNHWFIAVWAAVLGVQSLFISGCVGAMAYST